MVRSIVKGQLDRLKEGAKADLEHKYACILAFDLEAAARLKSWESFDQILQACTGIARLDF